MLGLVFTEFMEMVEQIYSLDMVDDLIDENELSTGGAYTSVGTYELSELVSLVVSLSEKTGTPVPQLLEAFGQHLMKQFVRKYPAFFDEVNNSFDFLTKVHDHIHVEVKKLYSNAELPSISVTSMDPQSARVEYRSSRALGDLAQGLIKGVAVHYNEQVDVQRESLPPGDGTHERFILRRH